MDTNNWRPAQTMSLQMQQAMVTKFQNAMPGNPPDPASLDSTAQTGTTNVGDWQEEVYQKIKIMKEMYLPDLNEMHQKIAAKLQQHDSLPQQPKTEQLEKLKIFKAMLERMIAVLQVSKNSITPHFKDKLSGYEKQIVSFINTHRPRKPVPPLQHGQLPLPHMHSMQQPQQSQSQLTQGCCRSSTTMPCECSPTGKHYNLSSQNGVNVLQQNINQFQRLNFEL